MYGFDFSGSLQGAGTIGGILAASLGGTTSVSSVFFAFDANGNVTELVGIYPAGGGTNGTLAAHYEFDPYGNVLVSSGDLASANPYRFSSKYTDGETELVEVVFVDATVCAKAKAGGGGKST